MPRNFVRAGLLLPMLCLLAAPLASAGDKALQAFVQAAAKLVEVKGEAAFPELRKPGRFFNKDHSVFVFDEQGFELVNPAFPELEGKNLSEHRDPAGKLVIQEELKVVRSKGAGFVDCLWPRPGGGEAVRTRAYVQGVRVGGRLLIVGSSEDLE